MEYSDWAGGAASMLHPQGIWLLGASTNKPLHFGYVKCICSTRRTTNTIALFFFFFFLAKVEMKVKLLFSSVLSMHQKCIHAVCEALQ